MNLNVPYKSSLYSLLIIILTVFASCTPKYYYDAEVDIPNSVWNSSKAAIFEPVVADTSQYYNMIISISNTDEYRYRNIWFFIKTISPEGKTHKDTLEYFIAQDNGKWLGEKDGDNYDIKMYYKTQVRFPNQGKYIFEIQQGMRDLELKGINKVGLSFEGINKKE